MLRLPKNNINKHFNIFEPTGIESVEIRDNQRRVAACTDGLSLRDAAAHHEYISVELVQDNVRYAECN